MAELVVLALPFLARIGLRHRVVGKISHMSAFLAGCTGGAAILLERKSRRIELALLLVSKSIESTWNILHHKKLVTRLPLGDVLVFSGAFAILAHAFENNPEQLRPLNHSALGAVFAKVTVRHQVFEKVSPRPSRPSSPTTSPTTASADVPSA